MVHTTDSIDYKMDSGIYRCSKALRKHNTSMPPFNAIYPSMPMVYRAMVHTRWFTSGVDGRDLEVLERVDCTVVTQQAILIFPSD